MQVLEKYQEHSLGSIEIKIRFPRKKRTLNYFSGVELLSYFLRKS